MAATKRNKQQGGFTLAEVLVVLVILGIAATVVIPMIGDTSGMRVTSAARLLASTLLFTQTAAISQQQQYQVVFDVAGESYEVQDAAGNVNSGQNLHLIPSKFLHLRFEDEVAPHLPVRDSIDDD